VTWRTLALALACSLAAQLSASTPASAQTATIDPGMTRAQVVAKLGEPLSSRAYESFTYLLYRNGCERRCGMNDLVVLDSGRVIDAVLRASSRHYSGTSSSPIMISMNDARRDKSRAAPIAVPNTVPKKPPT
jgi:hypothetical protein